MEVIMLAEDITNVIQFERKDLERRSSHQHVMADELSNYLANNYILYMKTLHFNWNMNSKRFSALHRVLEEQCQGFHDAGKKIAERIKALGVRPIGTYHHFHHTSIIQEEELLPGTDDVMVSHLIRDHEVCISEGRKIYELAARYGDKNVCELMSDRRAFHDDAIWKLRSSLYCT